MRIPASVLKGIRVGLSGTSLALAVGCNTPSSPPGSDSDSFQHGRGDSHERS